MMKIRSASLKFVLSLVFSVAYAASSNPVGEYLTADANDRGTAAETLCRLSEQGKLTGEQANRIFSVLQPRLLHMRERVLKDDTQLNMYAAELRLSWILIRQGLISGSERQSLVQALDPSWCRYRKSRSKRDARIELHGRLISPIEGTVMHHKVWIEREGQKPLLELEGFICNRRESTASIDWGLERPTSFEIGERTSLPLVKETVVYSVPAELARELPERGNAPEKLEVFRKALAHEKARKLCSFKQSVTLKQENEWQTNFPVDK